LVLPSLRCSRLIGHFKERNDIEASTGSMLESMPL